MNREIELFTPYPSKINKVGPISMYSVHIFCFQFC